MAALPFFISALSLAYSVIPPDVITLPALNTAARDSRSPASPQSASRHFFSGVVFGVGISTLISYELRRRRILERIRVAFFSWLNDGNEEIWTEKYRKPVKVLELEGERIIQSADGDETGGCSCALLSPDWALTTRFNVVMLTLTPGTELLARKSKCVEFYYVIKGDGTFICEQNKERISSGSAFIVDPNRERGFMVRGRGDLVLLRASDSSTAGELDETRFVPTAFSSTAAVVNAALDKMGTLVNTYSEQSGGVSDA